MKSVRQMIRKIFTVEHFVHAIIVAFACASVANIASLFKEAGHSEVGYALGAALGFALVAVSIMATKIDRDAEPLAFRAALVTATALAILSGAIQSRAYSLHLPLQWAVLVGFGIPICGEVLLAFVAAEFDAASRRKRIRVAAEGSREKIADAIAEAMSDVDVSEVKADVEKQVKIIVRHQVKSIAAEMMGKDMTPAAKPSEMSSNAPRAVSPLTGAKGATVEKMNEVKRDKVTARRAEILDYIGEGGHKPAEFAKLVAGVLNVTPRTIGRDLSAMQESGLISVNGTVEIV